MVVDFKTEQGDWSFVKMNSNCTAVDIDCKIYTSIYDVTNGVSGPKISNQEIDISIIGFVKDLTEEDWEQIVDEETQIVKSTHNLFSQEEDIYYLDYQKNSYTIETAEKSGKSLMNSLEVYLENPVSYPENPEDQGCIDAWQHCGERNGSWLLIQYN